MWADYSIRKTEQEEENLKKIYKISKNKLIKYLELCYNTYSEPEVENRHCRRRCFAGGFKVLSFKVPDL